MSITTTTGDWTMAIHHRWNDETKAEPEKQGRMLIDFKESSQASVLFLKYHFERNFCADIDLLSARPGQSFLLYDPVSFDSSERASSGRAHILIAPMT
jgi:hypothetical protein